MYIPTQGKNFFTLFYHEGSTEIPKPGKVQVKLYNDELIIQMIVPHVKTRIPKDNIKDTQVSFEVNKKQLSVGKAVIGGILAGGVGAVAGAAMGGKKVDKSLTITYQDGEGNTQTLLFDGKQSEVASQKIRSKYIES